MNGYRRSALIGRQDGYPASPRGFDPTVYQVADSGANAARRYQLNFYDASVAGLATVNVAQLPQVLFRPERLIIPSHLAPNFEIVDILVGNRTQLVAPGNTSAEVFTEVSIGTGLLLDSSQPGVAITLIVTNITGIASPFYATFLGAVVTGSP